MSVTFPNRGGTVDPCPAVDSRGKGVLAPHDKQEVCICCGVVYCRDCGPVCSEWTWAAVLAEIDEGEVGLCLFCHRVLERNYGATTVLRELRGGEWRAAQELPFNAPIAKRRTA